MEVQVGVAATEEEREDRNFQLPRMETGERKREGHLHRLPSNPRQKTRKTKI